MLLFAILLATLSLIASEDLYKTLEVRRSATDDQIKKAFKQLSLKYHPDRTQDPKAQKKYTKIVNAYEVLKDPQRKQQYDLTGSTDANANINMHNMRNQNSHFYYHQGGDPFQGFQQMFRQFQQQASHQRQRAKQQWNNPNQQQYELRQFRDQYGRIRTVMVKKNRGGSSGGMGQLGDLLFLPVQMIIIFLMAYCAVSLFCSDDKNNKAEHPKQNNNKSQNIKKQE